MAIAGLLLLLGRLAEVMQALMSPRRQRRLWEPYSGEEER